MIIGETQIKMKGKMIMEKKDFSKLTPEEISELIINFDNSGGCAHHSCDKCAMSPRNYINCPTDSCNDVFRKELLKRIFKYESTETDETIDTITITPETTNINWMVSSGYIHILASAFDDTQNIRKVCDNAKCGSCKLNGNNFSYPLNIMECTKRREFIQTASRFLKLYEDGTLPSASAKGTCENCKHLNKVGDYLFCNAWKNYTTSTMQCGYHEPIDK